jgi:hypothetical protein
MAEALQQELLTIPGIAGAEVDEDHGVAGVRVQLAEGADADAVGVAVRRILVEHGMRPSPGDTDEPGGDGPPPPPGAPGSVVSFPLVGEHATPTVGADAQPQRRLESVAVEETPDGIAVLIRDTDGMRATRSLQHGASGMDEAITDAVAQLRNMVGTALVGVAEAELDGTTVVTVLIDLGERRRLSGSAVQQGGRAYAVALAAWSALDRA